MNISCLEEVTKITNSNEKVYQLKKGQCDMPLK